MIPTVEENAVPVDPTPFDEGDVVVYDKSVHRGHQLKIAEIRQDIGLHNSQLQGSPGRSVSFFQRGRVFA
jgi:hypothetical protein